MTECVWWDPAGLHRRKLQVFSSLIGYYWRSFSDKPMWGRIRLNVKRWWDPAETDSSFFESFQTNIIKTRETTPLNINVMTQENCDSNSLVFSLKWRQRVQEVSSMYSSFLKLIPPTLMSRTNTTLDKVIQKPQHIISLIVNKCLRFGIYIYLFKSNKLSMSIE